MKPSRIRVNSNIRHIRLIVMLCFKYLKILCLKIQCILFPFTPNMCMHYLFGSTKRTQRLKTIWHYQNMQSICFNSANFISTFIYLAENFIQSTRIAKTLFDK